MNKEIEIVIATLQEAINSKNISKEDIKSCLFFCSKKLINLAFKIK